MLGNLLSAVPRLLLGLIITFADVAGAASPEQPEAASGFTPRPAARSPRSMVVTAHPLATAAALEMLRAGGGALDAAVAAQMVLNVVEPQSSGIGGGGFLLHYAAAGREVMAYDGRETAPTAAGPERFLDPSGAPLPFAEAMVGGASVGVPGLLAMLEMAHRDHGRLPWGRLLDPAIRLAEAGFPVSPRLHALLAGERHLAGNAAARALFFDTGGAPLAEGALLRNPELARVFRRIAREGSGAFYRGSLAGEMAAAVRGHPTRPGDLSEADLAAYRAQRRPALCRTYRGYRVCGMPPPSSGGVTTLQILGLLERLAPLPEGPMAPLAAHRFAEAGRLAYADRARYLADADFVPVPVAGLLDPDYLARRAALVDDGFSLGRAPAGEPPAAGLRAMGQEAERPSTTHLSIVDGEGNGVALTSSIENAFGSRILVRGFLLNNQLTDFSFLPGSLGRPVANRVEPGKRPRSSMAPTLVFDARGRLYALLGSPGGSRIINYVARALTALLDWRLPPQQVVALPHVGSRNGDTELERGTQAEALAAPLRARGHPIAIVDMTSGLHLIVRGDGGWLGAADPRREGQAQGE